MYNRQKLIDKSSNINPDGINMGGNNKICSLSQYILTPYINIMPIIAKAFIIPNPIILVITDHIIYSKPFKK